MSRYVVRYLYLGPNYPHGWHEPNVLETDDVEAALARASGPMGRAVRSRVYDMASTGADWRPIYERDRRREARKAGTR